jgi:NAD(P)-dependent dehydrogenase (short-subunit alcohol dehydrogenase family)
VNAVLPCATETEGFAMSGSAELKSFAISQTPLGRMGRPVDIANAAAFFGLQRCARVKGQLFPYLVASA